MDNKDFKIIKRRKFKTEEERTEAGRERQRKYREKNREKVKEYNAKYYAKIKEYRKKYQSESEKA